MPPRVVASLRSPIALTNPSAAVPSRGVELAGDDGAGPAADPGEHRDVLLAVRAQIRIGWLMIPEPVLNCHRGSPVFAFTALNQPSIVP